MRKPFLILALMAFGASSATAPAWSAEKPKLPRCDGGERRDANPYGSVLPGAPRPAVTMPPQAGKPVAAYLPAKRGVGRTRSQHYPSC
ncbi:hypothetical protein EOD43_18670 [Sphingomonas crocodyli]|uniref:Uncharacterized protein n=1 Tax=Sphingomonas crocodyli TaxID=1979270 RepID=A0A437LY03_9SPHN|nr:hypothetical protein EOD43_18670 [Sphingomonas crocodyli]